ncbi:MULTISPECIES: LPS export ABC transporter permease LptG [unclassified Afipia]|jgi:lipopolysaccharide export system permease protein|uniref:LPS export ABC transporter permease LptG n=2 Tax=Pseudomonadota TaxID=1224 RepID=UPI00041A0CA9|nr:MULTISPECIES: LPS export ABC transporter permease LptG [unclassified Afipia]MBS4005316.1 LPS export ABC transporter permease LptG [Afipia sp.]WIG51224.1 MAG: Lipopolysaccharide export system permease protein LptG [Afipia sp.]
MVTTILARYFAGRFVIASVATFAAIFVLIITVDYIELMRRAGGLANVSGLFVAQTALFRVPLSLEKLMPFCILIGAMVSFLALSRRLELVVARASGISAWQFTTPALISALVLGTLATVIYNPLSAEMLERAKGMERRIFTDGAPTLQDGAGFWLNQSTSEGQSVINAARSQGQGALLTGISVFRYDTAGIFRERIEAQEATLEPGRWVFKQVRRYTLDNPVIEQDTFTIATTLTLAQVRNSFSTPETVSFWQLPDYIKSSENSGQATAGYRLQYHKLIARPFLLAAMVMLAAAVSLRFFRFGGVQKMVLSGVAAGFLLYVLSKVTEDLSKAELMHPLAAAWLPVCVGGLSGFLALLYQEDG